MKVLVALITLISTAYASGSGEHHSAGHVGELMWPAFNFVILVGFLVWKIKTPLKEMFEKNANDVKYIFEHAGKKDKEASIKLSALQEKMASLDNEKNKILKSAEKEADDFIIKAQRESKEYIERLKVDSESKLGHERTTRIAMIEANLVDEVMAKVKNKIESNSDLSNKVSKNLVSKIK